MAGRMLCADRLRVQPKAPHKGDMVSPAQATWLLPSGQWWIGSTPEGSISRRVMQPDTISRKISGEIVERSQARVRDTVRRLFLSLEASSRAMMLDSKGREWI